MQVMTSNSATEPLQWREIADRPLRNDEIRVTVRAAGVNPVDWKMRQGDLLGIAQKLIGPPGSLVCGIDFAGDIIEIGSGVTDLKVGDRVVGGTDFRASNTAVTPRQSKSALIKSLFYQGK